jgi:hypothetical protein
MEPDLALHQGHQESDDKGSSIVCPIDRSIKIAIRLTETEVVSKRHCERHLFRISGSTSIHLDWREVMIIGAHSIIYSTNPEADRAFLRDVLKFPFVDVGSGWLVFGLPHAEVAVHPSGVDDVHEFYLMCDNVQSLIAEMKDHDVVCSEPLNQTWGSLVHVTMPGGGKLGIYEPRHARPNVASSLSKPTKFVSRKKKTAVGMKKSMRVNRKRTRK